MPHTTQRPSGGPVSAGASPAGATVIGAGIAGSWTALLLAEAGLSVTVLEAGPADMSAGTSYWAGGMLAPGAESDSAEPSVIRLGRRSVDLWRREPTARHAGSLVVSHPRDRPDLDRFERQTVGHVRVDGGEIERLEPALAGRFGTGLFFADEGHVEPRRALASLHGRLRGLGVTLRFDTPARPDEIGGTVIDCRGLGAREAAPDLRGVRGETLLVETQEVALARPVRLMHPRWPLYVIPRGDGRFLVGATSIESEDRSPVSVRSALELMSALYALHPAFGEARILELGVGLRPAFPDNAPRIDVAGDVIAVNGLYRHGFLLAPALAEIVAGYVTTGARDNEVMRWS